MSVSGDPGVFSIGQILAIMRQWVPQTQHAIDSLVLEVLKRGAHPDDRDSLTDMSLLMYRSAVKKSSILTLILCKSVQLQGGCERRRQCRLQRQDRQLPGGARLRPRRALSVSHKIYGKIFVLTPKKYLQVDGHDGGALCHLLRRSARAHHPSPSHKGQ